MDDLVQWLTMCLDEDERVARGTGQSSTSWRNFDMDGELRDDLNAGTVAYVPREETRAHVAEWSPARVLREIDAKRKLLDDLDYGGAEMADARDHVARRLASVYSDRPGYREQWRP